MDLACVVSAASITKSGPRIPKIVSILELYGKNAETVVCENLITCFFGSRNDNCVIRVKSFPVMPYLEVISYFRVICRKKIMGCLHAKTSWTIFIVRCQRQIFYL